MRGRRAERRYDTAEFVAMARRMIRKLADRVGGSDLAEFAALWSLRVEIERACADAIDGLRAEGFTWSQIAAQAGQKRQSLTQWRERQGARSEGRQTLREAGK